MRTGARLALVLPLLILLSGTLLFIPSWTGFNPSSWFLSERERENWRADKEFARELERHARILDWRLKAKMLVVQAWQARQLTYLETAAWFHRLNEQPANFPHPFLPASHPSREEQAGRQVIAWCRLPSAPCLRGGVREQLEAELAREQARPGGLVLPSPPPLAGIPCCPDPEP